MYVLLLLSTKAYTWGGLLFISMSIFKHSARVRQAKFKFHIRLSFRGDFKIAVTAAILDIVGYLDLPERLKLPERLPKYRKDQRIIGI